MFISSYQLLELYERKADRICKQNKKARKKKIQNINQKINAKIFGYKDELDKLNRKPPVKYIQICWNYTLCSSGENFSSLVKKLTSPEPPSFIVYRSLRKAQMWHIIVSFMQTAICIKHFCSFERDKASLLEEQMIHFKSFSPVDSASSDTERKTF